MARTSWYLTGSVQQNKKRLIVDGAGKPIPNRYGNDQYQTSTVTLTGVVWEPRPALKTDDEDVDRQQHVVRGMELFCSDPLADVAETDTFTIDGQEWEVSAPVNRFTGARIPANNYCKVILTRETG